MGNSNTVGSGNTTNHWTGESAKEYLEVRWGDKFSVIEIRQMTKREAISMAGIYRSREIRLLKITRGIT